MAGLMYPAYQKYYSALCNLKRFSIEKNFFDNISSLDNFFSEYRSVTLVMQKSLSHTPYLEMYERLSKGIWDKFFNEQRVKAVHLHPVEFTKMIEVTAYSPSEGIEISKQSFTIEDDIPLPNLIDSLKDHFREINPIEVFFSANFSFIENESGENLWDKLIPGLETMRNFMDAMYFKIGEVCPLCEQLRTEIEHNDISEDMLDFLFVLDYVYYPEKETFERGERVSAYFKVHQKEMKKPSIERFLPFSYLEYENSAFDRFVLMNTIIGKTDLMPTIMIIYKDGTYDLDLFHADIKTTFYRKINETADKILNYDVKEVFIMSTYVYVEYEEELLNLTSKERIDKSIQEQLVFMKVDCDLNEEEYAFDEQCLSRPENIFLKIKNGKVGKLNIGAVNLNPIVCAFKSRSKKGEE